MARNKNLGALLAADDEVPTLKPRSKAAQVPPTPAPGERMVRIVLEENDNIPPTGQFISLNGRTWMLRPGEEADVPYGVVNILNDAVQETPQIDQATKQVVGYRKRLRFPYRVVQPETAAA
jgi:hypothetical protein